MGPRYIPIIEDNESHNYLTGIKINNDAFFECREVDDAKYTIFDCKRAVVVG